MKKLFAGFTQYQLLIFLLLKNKDDKVIYIFHKYLEEFSRKAKLKEKVIILREHKPKIKNLISYIKYYLYLKKNIKKLNISKDTILYGDNEINFILPNNLFLCRLEDGTGNYGENWYKDTDTLKKKLYFFITSIIYLIFFQKKLLTEKEKITKRINKYYATEMAPKNLWFEKIVERISLRELWNKKTEEEQKEILEIFNFNNSILQKIKKGKILLLTQALDNSGLISEEEKIELYRKILKKYPQNDVVIKTHPRETTDYTKIFPEYTIIDEQFPMELLALTGINIKRVVTISSGGIELFKKFADVDIYGNEISDNLLKKAGSVEHLYKRNAYL